MPEHRSSKLTFLLKYFFVPFWAANCLPIIIMSVSVDTEPAQKLALGTALLMVFGFVWLIPGMVRLKSVEAFEDHLVVKGLFQKAEIPYEDVEWLYEIVLIEPLTISLKFKNRPHVPFRKILIVPSNGTFLVPGGSLISLFRDSNMTQYIRERIKEVNPTYSRDHEPPSWLPAALFYLSGLLVAYLFIRITFS